MATVDVLQVVDAVPGPNEKVTARSARVEAGGPALNAAITAAALGASVTLVTAVGEGPFSDVVRRDCAEYDVGVVDCAPTGYTPPISTVLLTESTGERAVVSVNAAGVTSYDVPAVGRLGELVAPADAVLVDGHHLPVGAVVAELAAARGVPVLLDGGSWKPGLDRVLPDVTVALLSADFHAPGGDSLEAVQRLGERSGEPGLRRRGAQRVFVARSAGARPVRWLAGDGSVGEVAVPQVEVVDTLGAGDVLHGAMLVELARHGLTDLPASLGRAAEVASRSVTAPGARGWLGAPSAGP